MWSMDRHQCAHGVVQHAECPSSDTYGNKPVPNFSRTVVQVPFKLPHQRLQVTFRHGSFFVFFTYKSPSCTRRASPCKAKHKETRETFGKKNNLGRGSLTVVRLGQHQLALGHSTRQLPGLANIGACNFRAWTAEKRAKETGDSPAKQLEFTALLSFNFALTRAQ